MHEGRGTDENLNATGMSFVQLNHVIPVAENNQNDECSRRVFEQWQELGVPQTKAADPDCSCNRLYVYGVMAALVALGSGSGVGAHSLIWASALIMESGRLKV